MGPRATYVLGGLAVLSWACALGLTMAIGRDVARESESLDRIDGVIRATGDLQQSASAFASEVRAYRPPPPVVLSVERDASVIDDAKAPHTREAYEADLANALAKCEPEAMLRYEKTVPFFIYGNPLLRNEVVAVLRRKDVDGARWRRAAAADAGQFQLPDKLDLTAREWQWQRGWVYETMMSPKLDAGVLSDAGAPLFSEEVLAKEEPGNRLVRMACACVNIFFNGDLLMVERLPGEPRP